MSASKLPLTLDSHWLVHDPARLALMSFVAQEPHSFMEVLRELGLQRSHIHDHTHRLEAVGYLRSSTVEVNHRTRTLYQLTPDGLQALTSYFHVAQGVTRYLGAVLTFTSR